MAVALGIENTFNNCCIAVVNDKKQILFEKNISFAPPDCVKQDTQQWPTALFEFHQKTLPLLLKEVALFISAASITVDFFSIATTPRPNHSVELAHQLARAFFKDSISIIEVDHVDAHLLSSLFSPLPLNFPFISLTIAGGHCNLRVAEDYGYYPLIGCHNRSPRNKFGHGRAVGSVLDKCAELLGLIETGHPDGAIKIDNLTRDYQGPFADFEDLYAANQINSFDFDFSFTYELTEKALLLKPNNRCQSEHITYIAASLQKAIMNIMLQKAFDAARIYCIPQVAFGGGVAANNRLRELAESKGKDEGIRIFFPPKRCCVDNAMMVALSGLIHERAV